MGLTHLVRAMQEHQLPTFTPWGLGGRSLGNGQPATECTLCGALVGSHRYQDHIHTDVTGVEGAVEVVRVWDPALRKTAPRVEGQVNLLLAAVGGHIDDVVDLMEVCLPRSCAVRLILRFRTLNVRNLVQCATQGHTRSHSPPSQGQGVRHAAPDKALVLRADPLYVLPQDGVPRPVCPSSVSACWLFVCACQC